MPLLRGSPAGDSQKMVDVKLQLLEQFPGIQIWDAPSVAWMDFRQTDVQRHPRQVQCPGCNYVCSLTTVAKHIVFAAGKSVYAAPFSLKNPQKCSIKPCNIPNCKFWVTPRARAAHEAQCKANDCAVCGAKRFGPVCFHCKGKLCPACGQYHDTPCLHKCPDCDAVMIAEQYIGNWHYKAKIAIVAIHPLLFGSMVPGRHLYAGRDHHNCGRICSGPRSRDFVGS